ncbi:SpoIID/LytB domain-containing protein [Ruthenibacterium lactatiformans]|uniref:SpoIID/LytB domain-containing protein n=1 Tax=Ruthenibacterium lactatiformans TaxID=1550024 RepID=UPI001322EF95|nr:SpoIID/LytB domain-containing protein [Ruthenibacterium lactatiformans]MTS77188.1 SpoIID/LytB domain-containing protein [Ruthenibacterium lactatiformans]
MMKEVLVNKMKRINKLYRMVLIGALSLCLCTSPAFAQESGSSEENSSMVSESSFEVYCTAEGTEDPTVPAEGTGDPTVPAEGTEDSTVPAEGTEDSTVPAEGTEDPTVPAEGTGDPTVPAEGTEDPTVPAEGTGNPTVPAEGTEDSTVPAEGTEGPTVPAEGTEDPTVPAEGTEDPTVPAEGTEDPTVPAEDADDMNSPESETDSLGTVRVEDGLQYGEDGRLYYYENGVPVTNRWIEQDGAKYWFGADGAAATGLTDIGTDTYYFGEDHNMVNTGWVTIGDDLYYFQWSGAMARSTWIGENPWKYYVGADGKAYKEGLHEVDGESYLFGQYQNIYGATSSAGGWQTINNDLYFITGNDSVLLNTWIGASPWKYYVGADGKAYKEGLHEIDGKSYLFGQYQNIYGATSSAGGWQTINNDLYFITADDSVLLNAWIGADPWRYYVGADGKAVSGMQDVETNTYYFDPVYKTVTTSAWKTLDEDLYYFQWDGTLARSMWIGANPWKYYVGADGKAYKEGLHEIDGKSYLFGQYQNIYGATSSAGGWQTINGDLYFIAADDSVLTNSWIGANPWKYYVGANGKAYKEGLHEIDGKSYLFGQYQNIYGATSSTGGWQTINNELYFIQGDDSVLLNSWVGSHDWKYYVGADGKAYRGLQWVGDDRYYFHPLYQNVQYGLQRIDGVDYYFDLETGALIGNRGIDVSSHNGVIDWNKVKADGISFVIVRAMHWSNASNSYVMDTMFVQNVYGAKSAGLLVGAYWFSEAFNGTEAAQEVRFIANSSEWKNLKQAGVVLDMPFYIDYEDYNWLNQHTTYESRTEAVRTGMDCVEQMLGTQSGFYTSDNYAQSWFNGQQLIKEGYNAWIARWSSTAPQTSGYVMWQYSNSGTVNGINGRVDLNYSYESYTFHPVTNYTGNYTTITVYDENTNKNVSGNITEIVKQIVANEVGGGLGLTGAGERAELYKAQAVAAHSYLVSVLNAGGTPSVGLTAYGSFVGLSDAVEAVKNQMLVYNGSVINAVYTASSGSHTNSAANMGWTAQPYLTSVESKYDSQFDTGYFVGSEKKPTFPWTYTTTQEQMRNSIQEMAGYLPSGDPSQWISVQTDMHGNVYKITANTTAGTVNIRPDDFLAHCLGVISMNIESFTYSDGLWTIKSYGNGHGVGMSQCGTAGYIANEGWNYKQILEHYYNGAKVV